MTTTPEHTTEADEGTGAALRRRPPTFPPPHNRWLSSADSATWMHAIAHLPDDIDTRPWLQAMSGTDPVERVGRWIAHAIRLTDLSERDRDEDWLGVLEPIHDFPRLVGTSSRITDRAVAAAMIRRDVARHGGRDAAPELDRAHHVAAWLAANGDQQRTAVAGHLARALAEWGAQRSGEPGPRAWLGAAWYATHGRRLVERLAGDDDQTGVVGRPAGQRQQVRSGLRAAVTGTHLGRVASKRELAEWAGVSRPTLDAWVSGT